MVYIHSLHTGMSRLLVGGIHTQPTHRGMETIGRWYTYTAYTGVSRLLVGGILL